MKKFFKLGKRMLALFIVVLLNINYYAAVGANDGSAFVTKAEFDALVNTFNEQMDSYQSGLNTKIDGAIANYLAGLSNVKLVDQTSIYDAIQKNADDRTVYWYGSFTDKETKLTDKIEQIGEVLFVKMDNAVCSSRVRIFAQTSDSYSGWPTKVGSEEVSGKYYYVDDNYCLKEYWENVHIKHYFSGSASNSDMVGATAGWSIRLVCNAKTFLDGLTQLGASSSTWDAEWRNASAGFSNTLTNTIMYNLEQNKEVIDEFKSGAMFSDVSTSNKIYVIKDGEKDKVDNYGTVTCIGGLCSHKIWDNSISGWKNGDVTGRNLQSGGSTPDKMIAYRNKSEQINVTQLASSPAIKVYEQNVLVTDGLPLVKCSDDGTLKFDMTFTTSSGGASDYVKYGFKKNTRFLNNQDDIKIQDNLDTNITTAVATNGVKVSVEIRNLKKNDEIWMKAMPLTANTYATCKIEKLVVQAD